MKHLAILLFFLISLYSCDNGQSSSSSSSSTYSPPVKTRMDGVKTFYNNFDNFDMCLGEGYGCHSITSVSLDGNYMKVSYNYKNGKLRGNIESNGSYSGTYTTTSTSGDFNMRFRTDGTANGSWTATSSMISFNGSMSIQ